MILTLLALLQTAPAAPHRIAYDDFDANTSGVVSIASVRIHDAAGDGVIRVTANDVTLDFAGQTLHGALADAPPCDFTGIGLVITGDRVTIRNLNVAGYKVGILAVGANGLILENCDVSDNFAQRLRSTASAEDAGDWLWPHRNDNREWATNCGAGICIERSDGVTVRGCRARRTQNGLILDRVTNARVHDNDFSFLSGWGIAMWRCEKNLISRNRLDFCIRGYSHGVYNRGQDSAGILMFEQNIDNIIVENSATHCGDGLFGFAGREALGDDWLEAERERLKKQLTADGVDAKALDQKVNEQLTVPADVAERYKRRGNRGNIIAGNDFSYAAAHGLEMTFSFDNWIINNRFVENAICGIWGGYSQATYIVGNKFRGNGDAGYGAERGGVNIEHGRDNVIRDNKFIENAVAVRLWWDDDAGMRKLPWIAANGEASTDNVIARNILHNNGEMFERIKSPRTALIDNHLSDKTGAPVSPVVIVSDEDESWTPSPQWWQAGAPAYVAIGEQRPAVGAGAFGGREKIIMAEWGPHDGESPLLRLQQDRGDSHMYQLLGTQSPISIRIDGEVDRFEVTNPVQRPPISLHAPRPNEVFPYELIVEFPGQTLRSAGVLISTHWEVTFFSWKTDPRENADAWRAEAAGGVTCKLPAVDFRLGGGGPSELKDAPDEVKAASLPRDRFGTIASTKLKFPAGKWKLVTESDDGIRVWLDDKLVIDDWTWHVPTRHEATFEQANAADRVIRIEHFELDGHAVLTLKIEIAN
jgi:hypothetical protein